MTDEFWTMVVKIHFNLFACWLLRVTDLSFDFFCIQQVCQPLNDLQK